MKRIVGVILCVFLLLGLTVSCGAAEKKVTMKLAGTSPANEELGEYMAMLKFAELVRIYSDGSINCEVYPANQLGTTSEFIEGTSLGTIEACVAGDTVSIMDPTIFVLYMPYLFKDTAHMRALLETDNEMSRKLNASMEEHGNLKPVSYLYRGFLVAVNSKRPIRTPGDMKNLTIRVPESAIQVGITESLGAMPVTITWTEVFTSLAQGVCDGVTNTITEFYSINLQEVVKYVSETNHMASIVNIWVNVPWFNSLSERQQEAILKAGKETTDFRAQFLADEQKKAFEAFEKKGIEILYHDQLDNEGFRAACKDVYKKFLDKFDEDLYIAIRDMKY